jgi:RNA polymerase sigma factor (sigma-70 family)
VSTVPPPFQRFLEDHRDAVWRLLVAAVGADQAEDCFQETFIAALRAYPDLRAGSDLRAWVLTIAHRKALDAHRARARRALPVAEPAASSNGAVSAPWSEVAPASERDEELWRLVRDLPERQRAAVVLRCVADLPHRQIATAIGCSEAAARRSLHEGLSKLREVVLDG